MRSETERPPQEAGVVVIFFIAIYIKTKLASRSGRKLKYELMLGD